MKFSEIVVNIVKQIPYGQVASYGQVAALAGTPRAARQVGWTLAAVGAVEDVPWWRVINKQGYLSIRNEDLSIKELQAALLRKEGIEVSDTFIVPQKYFWQIQQYE